MTDKTLYLLQSEFAKTETAITQLEQVYSDNDAIVLMGDAVLFAHDLRWQTKPQVFVLQQDAIVLSPDLASHIQAIDYDQFANLVLQFKRCISLK